MVTRNVLAVWGLAKRKLPPLAARDASQRAACLMGWRDMPKKCMWLCGAISLLGGTALSAAEPPKGTEGTLVLDKKTYQFSKAVAFETTIDNEAAITGVLGSKEVPGEKIKEAREN